MSLSVRCFYVRFLAPLDTYPLFARFGTLPQFIIHVVGTISVWDSSLLGKRAPC